MVEGVGFEPTKASPADLQSAPVDRLGTPPSKIKQVEYYGAFFFGCQPLIAKKKSTTARRRRERPPTALIETASGGAAGACSPGRPGALHRTSQGIRGRRPGASRRARRSPDAGLVRGQCPRCAAHNASGGGGTQAPPAALQRRPTRRRRSLKRRRATRQVAPQRIPPRPWLGAVRAAGLVRGQKPGAPHAPRRAMPQGAAPRCVPPRFNASSTWRWRSLKRRRWAGDNSSWQRGHDTPGWYFADSRSCAPSGRRQAKHCW